MPWNDSSKPPKKPGPWETPSDGERPGGQDAAKPRQTGVQPPWGRPSSAPKPPPARPQNRGEERKATTPPARGPHLDELSRQLRLRLANAALRPMDRRVRISLLAGGIGFAVAAWALGGLYVVEPDETAIVARFGAVVDQLGPGLHYHLPFPFETVRRLPLGVQRLALGSTDGDETAGRMLTRDGDLVEPAYSVQWRIIAPKAFLAGLADPSATLRLEAESALREAIGQLNLSQVLGPGHGQADAKARALLQGALDHDKAGIEIASFELSEIAPPDAAQAGFHDISAAQGDAQTAQREAQAYHDRVVAEAKADAAKLVQTSQGYRDQEVSEAKGEAARFALIDAQARKSPQTTRERLYTETMERVLHNTPKVIVPASSAGSTPIALPPELFHARPADAPAAQPGAANAGPAGQSPGAPAA